MTDPENNKAKARIVFFLGMTTVGFLFIGAFGIFGEIVVSGVMGGSSAPWAVELHLWLVLIIAFGVFGWILHKSRHIKQRASLDRSLRQELIYLGIAMFLTLLSTLLSRWLLELYRSLVSEVPLISKTNLFYELSRNFDYLIEVMFIPSLLLLTLVYYLIVSSSSSNKKRISMVLLVLVFWLGILFGAEVVDSRQVPTLRNIQISQQRHVEIDEIAPKKIGWFIRSEKHPLYRDDREVYYIPYESQRTGFRVDVAFYKYGDNVNVISRQGFILSARKYCYMRSQPERGIGVYPVITNFDMPVYLGSYGNHNNKPLSEHADIQVCWPWENYAIEIQAMRSYRYGTVERPPILQSQEVRLFINKMLENRPSEIGDYNYTFNDYLLQQSGKGD